jgi:hypothetical protein
VALNMESSVLGGVAVGALVYGTYQMSLPSVADVRSLESNNADVAKAEKVAAWTSAAVVSGVSLIARDPTIFVIGGTIMIAISWASRHANAVTPTMRRTMPEEAPRVAQGDAPENYSTPTNALYEGGF